MKHRKASHHNIFKNLSYICTHIHTYTYVCRCIYIHTLTYQFPLCKLSSAVFPFLKLFQPLNSQSPSVSSRHNFSSSVFKTPFQFNCVVKGLLSWNNSQPHPFRSPKYLHKYPQSYVQPMSSAWIHLKTIAMYVQLEAWIVEKIIFLYFRFMRRKHNL